MSGRLLLCSTEQLTRTLGVSKVPIELADAMRQRGWTVDVVGPEDYVRQYDTLTVPERKQRINEELRRLIISEGAGYDVVDYQIQNLPFDRALFSESTLLVARTPLLHAHLDHIRFPQPLTLRRLAGKLFRDRARQRFLQRQIETGLKTAREADLIVVNNETDRAELVRRGEPRDKVRMIPLGLSSTRLDELEIDPKIVPANPTVAFVGTFDWRKGAADFPSLVSRVKAEVPTVQFRLLGTRGMFREEKDVRRQFPRALQGCIEVVPTFTPEALPRLLATCSVGVFPSYLEGFGFGVLEMLAASLPVIAYDAPGPPAMLPSRWLVAPGDKATMADKLVRMLTDHDRLCAERHWAAERAQKFTWAHVAAQSEAAYANAIERRAKDRSTTYPV